MFEAAELGRKLSKPEFNAIAPDLRLAMVEMQQALRRSDFPVIVLFAGVDGAGKSESVNLLNEWMDPRWIVTRAYGRPSDEERERPEFWRYWRDLPAAGQIGLFQSAWYTAPLLDRVYRRIGQAKLDARLERIASFERTLADDGALILKFWMHLDKKAQKERLKKLEKDPYHHWKITSQDWDNWKRYEKFIETSERIIMRTSTAASPWCLVEAADPPYRAHTVLTTLHKAVSEHIDARTRAAAEQTKRRRKKPAASAIAQNHTASVLSCLDLSKEISRKQYGKELRKLRARLHGLYRQAKEQSMSTVLVFEGWDAGGKGGAIRRLTAALDARDYRVIPIAAPTDEERAHHYLWRFWRHIARSGRFTIFDRSWYGRVLVEHVEHLISEDTYRRAFAEINDFEEQLTEHGIVLAKFWLHIDPEEQERRFLERKNTPYKSWKLTDEDWRNRDNWDAYEATVDEMVERTSTVAAPWTLVEANNKHYARLKVIRTLCDRMEAQLKQAK